MLKLISSVEELTVLVVLLFVLAHMVKLFWTILFRWLLSEIDLAKTVGGVSYRRRWGAPSVFFLPIKSRLAVTRAAQGFSWRQTHIPAPRLATGL